jgi:hypothetical protein
MAGGSCHAGNLNREVAWKGHDLAVSLRLLPSAVCSCRAVLITVPTPEVNTSERFAPVITTDLTPRHSWAPQGRVLVVLKMQAVVGLESLEGSSQVTLFSIFRLGTVCGTVGVCGTWYVRTL